MTITVPASSRELIFRARRAYRAGGVRDVVRGSRHVLNARWALRKANAPLSVRLSGRARVSNYGTLTVGERVRLDGRKLPINLACFKGATLSIGEGTFVNYGCDISATTRVEIGRNCDIGQLALIMDSDWHSIDDHRSKGPSEAIVIEDDVWIGARVTILRGARIGAGSVIGAHAVVRGEIPPRSVAGGVPARVIRTLPGADGAG